MTQISKISLEETDFESLRDKYLNLDLKKAEATQEKTRLLSNKSSSIIKYIAIKHTTPYNAPQCNQEIR